MDTEQTNITAWTTYGNHHLHRKTDVPEVDRLTWGFWPTGPGAEILGDLTGRRVLDLGSGTGRYAAHLAREHGATVDAVDASPSQHQRATERYGRQPGLNLILSDAVEHLQHAEPYDVIYSNHGAAYIDPRRLLPALASALTPGGRLALSVLHTNSAGHEPSDSVTARPEILPLAGGGRLTVQMWVLAPTLWKTLFAEHGLVVDQMETLTAPEESNPLSCSLLQVHRHVRITSRPPTTPRSRNPHRANSSPSGAASD